MSYNLWLVINSLMILAIAIFIYFGDLSKSQVFSISKGAAFISIWLFLTNASMYLIFRMIKKSKKRNVKIFFVKLSRKIFKLHIYFAITGASLILIHTSLMVLNIENLLVNLDFNIITGIYAFFFLIITLSTGYYRYLRATGYRRKIHLASALTFTLLFILHIII